MDLWIRSQDKSILTKVNNLFVCKYFDKYIISNYYNEYPNDDNAIPYDLFMYGTYKTKERALEVLDEIQEYLEHNCKNFVDTGDYYTSKYEFKVYKMPTE